MVSFLYPLSSIFLPAFFIQCQQTPCSNLVQLDPGVFIFSSLAIWSSCFIPLHLIDLSFPCKSQQKTHFSPLRLNFSVILPDHYLHAEYLHFTPWKHCWLLTTADVKEVSYLRGVGARVQHLMVILWFALRPIEGELVSHQVKWTSFVAQEISLCNEECLDLMHLVMTQSKIRQYQGDQESTLL